jgi:hypothetical protein
MSMFERPAAQPDSDPNHNILIPFNTDNEWCADFNATHGYRGKRTVLPAVWIMRDPNYSILNRISMRSYDRELLDHSTWDPVLLDGEIVNMRLVPYWYGEGYVYMPHLTMRDVIDQASGPVTDTREEIWVPAEPGEELQLY